MNKKIILMNDLDCYGMTWRPIKGTFTGDFSGNNFLIRIKQQSETDTHFGLFERLSGTVQNLMIEATFISKIIEKRPVIIGAIAAEAFGEFILTNCHLVSNRIRSSFHIDANDNIIAGGLIGRIVNPKNVIFYIESCSSHSDFHLLGFSHKVIAGGIFGEALSEVHVSNSVIFNSTLITYSEVSSLLGYIHYSYFLFVS